jgi:hypothetical protein
MVPTTGTGATGSWGISVTGSSASTTGNAATATALATARNINGVPFDGTGNITIADSTKLPLTGGTMTGQLTIENSAPTITMADTSATGDFSMHVNSGNWYVRNNSSANVFSVSQTGVVVASNNITAFSDARLKENVVTIDSALDKVSQMRGVYYNRIDDENKTRNIGVIAQEIEAILPEVVHTREDDMKSVAYGNIVGILIEAIKELNEEVKTLRSMLDV